MNERLLKLSKAGQSVWIDSISLDDLVEGGALGPVVHVLRALHRDPRRQQSVQLTFLALRGAFEHAIELAAGFKPNVV